LLPRISAAISQFIKPVNSARDTTTQRDGNSNKQQHHKKHDPSSEHTGVAKPRLKVVSQNDQLPAKAPLAPVRALGSVAEALVLMLTSLARHRASFMKWLGPRAYRDAVITRKKATNFRKGSILDVKAE
jgi:hypothetical protein